MQNFESMKQHENKVTFSN